MIFATTRYITRKRTAGKKHKGIVFEMVKMSVGLFLICHPDVWKIYAGCVFIMFVAVYFSFAKKFNSAELDIEIHSTDEVD